MGEQLDRHEEPSDVELSGLRSELSEVHQTPLDERVRLFERANEVLAARLAALDEV